METGSDEEKGQESSGVSNAVETWYKERLSEFIAAKSRNINNVYKFVHT